MSVKKRVQKQMEFYLSASNLRSDKFLQQSMDDEGYMPIDVFLTFNRMKAIGATTRILTDAIRKSPLMVLSDDEAYVRPTELPDYDDDDSIERTIYIENFSAGSDHDSLRKLFSPFGKVNLVSMPRFPGSRKFKGFAFIEFASVEAVAPVLEVLKAHKKTAPSPDAPPTAGISGMAKARWVALRDSLKAQMAMAHTDTSSCSALQHAVESASTAPAPDFFTRGLLVQLTNVPVDTPRKALKAALEVAAPVAFLDDTKLRAGGSVVVARFLSTSHSANGTSLHQPWRPSYGI
ncbi:hypothetical protein SPRG_01855 [Saprolegnia parasitica CBS 223.65]|uniref:HTH La-type RNA-binding domain-containing protein n=1 Tax=Saprolegnia parasitica (strain CBS 223.65) TaxID=695850 RepID=A0A067CUV3_SAPPC|nr:hypothetical protein SPRG_01855 [Saprolegnia parasitica CBS 223.65]KDO33040.1 hypothetical protein SPRG_01855 [Saprolegnia parasitica CBS 223.65]|eukprot:XP_012195811.1 hypothetical protein SPRG_01855 [Saprolegnia parasitica CBS 223.65]